MPLIRNKSDNPTADSNAGDPTAGLRSASADERWSAARATNDVPALTAALAQEKEPRVREAIFTGLARIATPESALAVLPYVGSDDANVRTGALDALRAMPQTAAAYLPRLLGDPDPDVRLLACDLARDVRSAEAPRLLRALLERESQANVCAAAVEVLAEIADASALPALSACAVRFPADPFLAFAIKIASDRLRAELP